MTNEKAYVVWHKTRMSDTIFMYLNHYDILKLNFDYIPYNKESESYSLYGYKIAKFNKCYYVYDKDNNPNNPNNEFFAKCESVEELNGLLCGMYKAYHNRYNFE